MLGVLSHEETELAHLGKRDAPKDEDDDRAMVGEPCSCLNAEEVGTSREERADRCLPHTAKLSYLHAPQGKVDRDGCDGRV